MKAKENHSWFIFAAVLAWLGAACLVPACGGGGGGDEDADADTDADAGDGMEDGADVPEICQGLDLCDTEGVTCEGNTLVTCAENADGCLVETREDCTTVDDGYCDGESDPPECGVMDPCEGIEQCAAQGRACEADILVICAPDANGCLVESREDCTVSDGGFCNGDLDPPACDVSLDPCRDVPNPCDTEGRSCDDDVLVVCEPDAYDCLVETRTDCADSGYVCNPDSDPVACADPCSLVELCPETVFCDGYLIVTCSEDEHGCLVRDTEVDCSTDGMICDPTLDPPECAEGSCIEAMRINCSSGTVNADTSDTDPTSPPYATTRLTNYSCQTYDYPGNEFIFVFTETTVSNVVVTSTRLASSGDFDLYALDGTGADCAEESLTCLDSSVGTTATEEVVFHAEADQPVFLVYDIYSDAAATTAFTLDIHCITCGDGAVDGTEECDDGDADDGDGCSSSCQVEPGWVCDDAEPSSCRETVCGDSTVEGTEECDDGDADDGDGCSSSCTVEAGWTCDDSEPSVCHEVICGDGIIEGAEECDDNGTDDGDGCSSSCTVESGWYCAGEPSFCWAGGETCSDPVRISPGSYVFDTTPYAGDYDDYNGLCGTDRSGAGPDMVFAVNVPAGSILNVTMADIVFFDEALVLATDCGDIMNSCVVYSDPGTAEYHNTTGADQVVYIVADGYSSYSYGPFTLDVQITAVVCGDGFIVGAEECDDNGTDDGDGCSSSCTVESGWHCAGEPSFCWTGGATCDDPFRLSAGSYVFSTEGYTSDYDDYMGDCSTTGYGGAGPDMVFIVGVPAGLTLSVTMDGLPSWDEVVVIASDCPDIVGSCLAFADYSDEMPAQVTNASGAEVVYYIVADGYFSSSLGEFSLDITVE